MTDEYKAQRYNFASFYSELGFNVVLIDSRGSNRRGVQFESAVKWRMVRVCGKKFIAKKAERGRGKRRLSLHLHVSAHAAVWHFSFLFSSHNPTACHLQGTFEIDDQVEGLEYLMRERILNIDAKRICVHGWSYGGYLSLQALLQRPDIFRVRDGAAASVASARRGTFLAERLVFFFFFPTPSTPLQASVAAAPVTMWEAYDTGYTGANLHDRTRRPLCPPSFVAHGNHFSFSARAIHVHARGQPRGLPARLYT